MIVITTPTGQIGQQVLDNILESGEPIRVIARDPSRLSPHVRERVEVIRGSHDDVDVVTKAFAGADCVFWLVPPNPHAKSVEGYYAGVTRPACEAIKRQGVKRVVGVSTLGRGFATNAGPLSAALAMDELIKSTGVSYRALRMPFLMENLLTQVEAIRSQGMFFLANSADRGLATVAARDIALMASELLLDGSWSGQGGVPVVGPDDLSPNDMARIMSEVLLRPVHVHQASSEAYKAAVLRHGMTEAWAQGLVAMATAQDAGVYDAERRTVQPSAPTSFRRWCADVLRPAVLASRARDVREGFAHLHAADPVLAALIDKRPEYDADAWLRERPILDMFGGLVSQIIGQQISVKAAGAILRRLTDTFDGHMPSPEDVASLDEQALRDLGLSWRKAKTVLDLAARFADGRLSEKRLGALPDDLILDELTQIPGIGPWTVHGALLVSLRRADVVPTGDIMLRHAVKTYYALDHLPTEAEFRDIAKAWSPYGSLGVNVLFAAVELD